MRGDTLQWEDGCLTFLVYRLLIAEEEEEPLICPWFVLGFIKGFLKAHLQIETKIPTHGKPQLKIKDVFGIFMSPRGSFCPLLLDDVAAGEGRKYNFIIIDR